MGEMATPAIPSLALLLNDTNYTQAAQIALSGMGSNAIPIFTNAFANTNQIIRESAIWGLVEMRTNAESILPLLIASLQDANPRIRRTAVISMLLVGTNQPAWVIPELINALEDSDRNVSVATIRTLGQFGYKATTANLKLIELLSNQQHVSYAANALTSILGKSGAVAPLVQALTNENARLCVKLMEVLGSFKAEASNAVPALLPFVQD